MQPEAPLSPPPGPARGLPPVAAPSGRFIAQLFLVPGLIVVVAVAILWGFSWLVGSARTPEQFLKDLKSGNAEIRWRAASDLAQVLKRDDNLASNPTFALDLAVLLRDALRSNQRAEKDRAEQLPREAKARPTETDKTVGQPFDKNLEDERLLIQFLMNCLGNCTLPVGAPLLNEIALKEEGADRQTVTLRRQVAAWALANLGENLKKLDQLSPERLQAIQGQLESEVGKSGAERCQWAQLALLYLQGRAAKVPMALDVDKTLGQCARAEDPMLRKITAVALNFWEGSSEENARIDKALLELCADQGRGAGSEAKLRGLEIRYKATEILARRGSDKAQGQLEVLKTMLDEEQQEQNFRTKLQEGGDIPNDASVQSTVTGALKAVAELHRKKPNLDLSSLYPAIDTAAHSAHLVVRSEAERTRIALDRK